MSRLLVFALLAGFLENARAISYRGIDASKIKAAPVLYDTDMTQFATPQLTPPQFLIISSPKEQKVVYTQLRNFKSVAGRTFPLIDSGLAEPTGIALDRRRGRLYVADRGANKIFHYRVNVERGENVHTDSDYTLTTDGIQLCILQGRKVEWLSVDVNGDLYFSDVGANAVVKLAFGIIEVLGDGRYQAGDISLVMESQLEVMSNAKAQSSLALTLGDLTAVPLDAAVPELKVYALYQQGTNPHVAAPAGVVSDGIHLYWVNGQTGGVNGTVVEGQVLPSVLTKAPVGKKPAPFPTTVLTNATDTAYGITVSNNMIFYSTNTTTGDGYVYGVTPKGLAVTFAVGLLQPRGLVWDGDGTVYVADQAGDAVWSFPVGRLVSGAPRTKTVDFRGAFGVAMLSIDDKAFQGGAPAKSPGALALLLLVFASAALVRETR